MIKTQNGSLYRTQFDSVSEFLDLAEKMPCFRGKSRYYNLRQQTWDLGADFPDAVRLARDGWPEGRKAVSEITERLNNLIGESLLKPDVFFDVAGDFVEMGRFVTGEPECMGQFTETEMPHQGRIVRVVYNYATSCDITAESMVKRGAATVALIDALEGCGRQCEVWAVLSVSGCRSTYECVVPVKRAGEMVEIDRMAFILAHPAMLRRLTLSIEEHEAEDIRTRFGFDDGGYGTPCDQTKFEQGEGTVVVPQMLWSGDEAATLAWVFSELKKQGVTVEEPAR